MQPQCIAATGDLCGEAARWSAEENCLYWTDINRFLLHRLDYSDRSVRTFFFDEPVVALSLTTTIGTLLVALGSEIVLFTPQTGERTSLNITLPDSPQVRFNDGRTDPNGVFWIGSMGNNVGPKGEPAPVADGLGKLFRFRSGGTLEEIEAGIGIANTLAWSPDRSRFYFGDTLKNEIRAYPFDAQTSELGEPTPHFADYERGAPDGSAIDSEGYLWNARWGGNCLVRISPDGAIDRVVEMPVANITTACFGGPERRTLFVTTAAVDRGPADQLAGCVFQIATDVAGMPENKFAL
ncbi:MAG: SMP-30/gluconolactonase/LRE family protein [Pseudomonadota bacterium]